MEVAMKTLAALIALAMLAILVQPVHAGPCRWDREDTAVLPADGVTLVTVDARAGDLVIVGRTDLAEVRVTAIACASDEDILEDIRLYTERDGDEILIEADIPSLRGWNRAYASLDLEIEVPAAVSMDVRDSSGDLGVKGVGSLDLQDSSGGIRVEKTTGHLRVRDSSGEISIEDVHGDVLVSDSSGEIEIDGVTGTVEILEDSSGGIDVSHVEGSVLIREDSSGDIVVEHVDGDVRVGSDSSGGIRVRDVGGDFSVDHDSSGDIRHAQVAGRLDLPRRRR
jgi:hypothetical protein